MSLLRKLELPTKNQLQAESLLAAFPTPLSFYSFLVEVKWTFTNFLTAHHNLRSSRATPSHLGGLTSKSNECHEDLLHKAQVLKGSQRGSSQLKLRFLTNHTNLIKRCSGELINA
jgi:hypothetical protein